MTIWELAVIDREQLWGGVQVRGSGSGLRMGQDGQALSGMIVMAMPIIF